jgi:hypothetical protein
MENNSDDSERAHRAAEIQSLPARHVKPDEPMDKKAAENVARGFSVMTNIDDGRKAVLPIETVGKILRNRGFDTSRIINAISELYETSLLGWSEPEILKFGHKAHSNIKEYHQYINKFTDGDNEYYIRFTVHEENARPNKTGRNILHATAISDIATYKKGDHPQHDQVHLLGEAGPSPFVDRKLQEFFDLSDNNITSPGAKSKEKDKNL